MRPIIFLSDLGVRDEFVGVCHAVIETRAPGAKVIDLSHGVPPQDVGTGAVLLADAAPFLPADSVVLGIVDPGSGSERKAVAVTTVSGMLLVGPDNGLLSMAWNVLGGIASAVEITASEVLLSPVSKVFQGRDVFAPAVAHVARGGDPVALGPALDPATLVTAHLNEPDVEHGLIKGEVFDVDRFGNVRLNVRMSHVEAADLAAAGELEAVSPAGSVKAIRVDTYREIPEGAVGLLVDAWGWLSLARFATEAASALDVGPGDMVWLKPLE
jgi:S-adenosyl-L-methionine hydrolase (adenosine-forming)